MTETGSQSNAPVILRDADAKTRKSIPLFSGVLRYFPDALVAVAELSRIGNDQHNPGQPLHWSRGKSNDHADCLVRHQLDAGTIDTDGVRHATKVAWRALAQLQLEIEAAAPKPVEYPFTVVCTTYSGVDRRGTGCADGVKDRRISQYSSEVYARRSGKTRRAGDLMSIAP